MRLLAIVLLAGAASPVVAQDHAEHAMSNTSVDEEASSECRKEAARHRAMGHQVLSDACVATEENADRTPDGSMTDDAEMDHSRMHHEGRSPIPPASPAPASADSGPAHAADAIWGRNAMAASRAALRRENGGQVFAKLLIDRLEYRTRDGRDGYAWEGQAWYGGDLDRFTLKSEGEGSFGGKAEQAEVQALWSHAIGPWFDLDAGLRHDFAGADRTHLVLGVQGLAPYEFEVDGSVFLSDRGDVTVRAEAELDQRITQRLILQPRAEVSVSVQDIPELGIGAGLDRAEIGVRLRYEIAREFAPYIGVAQEWRVGRSADYARSRGEDVQTTSFVFGLRTWF